MKIDINQFTEVELTWYYHASDASVGFSSNWNAMVYAANYSSSSKVITDRYTDGILANVDRKRKIEKALFSLPGALQKALYGAYAVPVHDQRIRAVYGRLGGTVAALPDPMGRAAILLAQKQSLTTEEQVLTRAFMVKAEESLKLANQQYAQARLIGDK